LTPATQIYLMLNEVCWANLGRTALLQVLKQAALCVALLACCQHSALASKPAQHVGAPFSARLATLADWLCFGECPKFIIVEGAIVNSSFNVLREAIEANPQARIIVLGSPGGQLETSIAMGQMIRQKGLDVIVARFEIDNCFDSPGNCKGATPAGRLEQGFCASACVNIFAGGVKRTLWSGSRLGVHRYMSTRRITRVLQRFRTETRKHPDGRVEQKRFLMSESKRVKTLNQEQISGYDSTRNYFESMGVDPDLTDEIVKTPNNSVKWIDFSQAIRLNLVNEQDSAKVFSDWLMGSFQYSPRHVQIGLVRTEAGLSRIVIGVGPAPGQNVYGLRAVIVEDRQNFNQYPLVLSIERRELGLIASTPNGRAKESLGISAVTATLSKLCSVLDRPTLMQIDLIKADLEKVGNAVGYLQPDPAAAINLLCNNPPTAGSAMPSLYGLAPPELHRKLNVRSPGQ
jgi:hypothetical protein